MAYFIPNANQMSLAGIPVIPNFYSQPWISGFEMSMVQSFSDVRQFTIQPGSARALTSDFVISYSPNSTPNLPHEIIVDTETVGINGCYPHSLESLSLARDTVFPVYIVGNASGTGLSASAPKTGVIVATSDAFLPAGYDSYCRIGLIYISTALDIIPWVQEGSLNERYYNLGLPIVMTTTTDVNFVPYDLTAGDGAIPPLYQTIVTASITLTNAIDGQYLRFSPYDEFESQVFVRTPVGKIAVSQQLLSGVNALGNATITLACEDLSQVIHVDLIGFKDTIRNAIF